MKTQLKTDFNSEHESLGFLLWRASNKLQRKHRAVLKDFDLTPSQFSLLAVIAYLERPNIALRQSALCEFTQIDKMLISDLVKSLIAKKCIQKRPDPQDARASLISITNFGLAKVNQAIAVVEQVDRDFFAGSSTQFATTLQRLAVKE